MSELVLRVERVGVRGDGVAMHRGEPVYLPFTAPGDIVRVRLAGRRGDGWVGEVAAFETEAPRAAPHCRAYGICGGCSMQHLPVDAYAAAKLGWLEAAMRGHGLDTATLRPIAILPPGTRRRARLSILRKRDGTTETGFRARASHRIVDMSDCAVLHPALFALLPDLRTLASQILAPAEEAAATATLAESGVDLLVDLPREPDLAALEALAAFAQGRVARLAWRVDRGEPALVAAFRPVRITFGGVSVELPYDAFLQASAEADRALTRLVLEAAAGAERIADLYAGVGTFSFALAALAPVHAVEGDAAAYAALRTAAAGTRVSAERRDLERRPLLPVELDGFDTVVFDPPRAGAKAQSEGLAASKVSRVAAVSCNQATFARDAKSLVEGGYTLRWVAPVDSFTWSAHLELVALFGRD